MKFILKQQEINILMVKYNVKKSLIKKVEKKFNMIGIVQNHNDYFNLIEVIISIYTYFNKQAKDFSQTKDNLIIGMSLDYIIEYELRRKYGINAEKYFEKSLIRKSAQ